MQLAVLAGAGIASLAALGCQKREPPDVARARVAKVYLTEQIGSLQALVARAERGELDTENQIAISMSEDLLKGMLDASLPRELVLADRLRLRIESAQPYFRGNRAALGLRARVSSIRLPDAYATLELGGQLENFAFEEGRLVARVKLAHFSVVESSVGDLAADVVENLVKSNLEAIGAEIPPLVVPVSFEQAVTIDGLTEGPVVAKPGRLPLAVTVAQIIPVNQRLWILVDAKAGPWQALAASEPKP